MQGCNKATVREVRMTAKRTGFADVRVGRYPWRIEVAAADGRTVAVSGFGNRGVSAGLMVELLATVERWQGAAQ